MRIVEVSLEMNCWGFSGNSHLWNRAMESHVVLAGFKDNDKREPEKRRRLEHFQMRICFRTKVTFF